MVSFGLTARPIATVARAWLRVTVNCEEIWRSCENLSSQIWMDYCLKSLQWSWSKNCSKTSRVLQFKQRTFDLQIKWLLARLLGVKLILKLLLNRGEWRNAALKIEPRLNRIMEITQAGRIGREQKQDERYSSDSLRFDFCRSYAEEQACYGWRI